MRFGDIVIKLEPMGRLVGSGSVNLEQPESIDTELVFQLNGGDLGEFGV